MDSEDITYLSSGTPVYTSVTQALKKGGCNSLLHYRITRWASLVRRCADGLRSHGSVISALVPFMVLVRMCSMT